MEKVGLEERLERYPELKEKFKIFLGIAENKLDGGIALADDVEERLIQEVRGLEKEIIRNWMESRSQEVAYQVVNEEEKVCKDVKKAHVAHKLRGRRNRGTALQE